MKKFGKLTPVVAQFLYYKQITICAGGPYAGKSRWSMSLANNLSKGIPTFLGPRKPIKVLYCSERDWDFNSAQLVTVGIKELNPNLKFFCIPDIAQDKVRDFDYEPLEYIAQTMFSESWMPDLVILDTAPHFQPVKGGMGEPTNSYSFNRKELLKAKRWAGKHNLSLLVVYHSPKQNEKNKYLDPFDKILGSTAILASSVAACILERQSDEEVMLHLRSHVSVMQTPLTLSYTDFSITKAGPSLSELQVACINLAPEEFSSRREYADILMGKLERSQAQVYKIISKLIHDGLIEWRENEATGEIEVKRRRVS